MTDPPPSGTPTSKIELTVSCINLRDKDYFSKSDPMVVLYLKESGSSTWREFGRTEVMKDTLNPRFTKKFVLNYRFEEYQKLKFEVYDVDTTRSRLTDHDFLGSTECSLGEIVAYQGIQFRRNLTGPHQHCGCIVVVAEELVSCKDDDEECAEGNTNEANNEDEPAFEDVEEAVEANPDEDGPD